MAKGWKRHIEISSNIQLSLHENCIVSYRPDFCVIQDLTSNTLIGVGDPGNGVYYLTDMHGGSAFTATKNVDHVRWHQQLEHPSYGSLVSLSTICDFKLNKDFLDCCDVCHRPKQTRNGFPLTETRASKPFGLIHCDLWGKYHTPSLSGCHYFLCNVDDFSRATWVFLLRKKIRRLWPYCAILLHGQNTVWDTC